MWRVPGRPTAAAVLMVVLVRLQAVRATTERGGNTVPENPFWRSVSEFLIQASLILGGIGVLFCFLYVIIINILNWLKMRKLAKAPKRESHTMLKLVKKKKHRRNKGERGAAILYGEEHKLYEGTHPRFELPEDDDWLWRKPGPLQPIDLDDERRRRRDHARKKHMYDKTTAARDGRDADFAMRRVQEMERKALEEAEAMARRERREAQDRALGGRPEICDIDEMTREQVLEARALRKELRADRQSAGAGAGTAGGKDELQLRPQPRPPKRKRSKSKVVPALHITEI